MLKEYQARDPELVIHWNEEKVLDATLPLSVKNTRTSFYIEVP